MAAATLGSRTQRRTDPLRASTVESAVPQLPPPMTAVCMTAPENENVFYAVAEVARQTSEEVVLYTSSKVVCPSPSRLIAASCRLITPSRRAVATS